MIEKQTGGHLETTGQVRPEAMTETSPRQHVWNFDKLNHCFSGCLTAKLQQQKPKTTKPSFMQLDGKVEREVRKSPFNFESDPDHYFRLQGGALFTGRDCVLLIHL